VLQVCCSVLDICRCMLVGVGLLLVGISLCAFSRGFDMLFFCGRSVCDSKWQGVQKVLFHVRDF